MKRLFMLGLAMMLMATLVAGGKSDDGKNEDGSTTIEFWTFQELHPPFYEVMAEKWNEKNPDRKIKLVSSVISDINSKLAVVLQSGKGAPDLVDIEISGYANFLRGIPDLVELNDVIEPELDNIVKSRVDIYSKDGKYYGIDFHVGAVVTYYNKEIMDQAGIDIDDIVTWEDYHDAGKIVLEKTGKPMVAIETTDRLTVSAMLSQLYSGFVDPVTGDVDINSPEMLKITTFLQGMLKDGTAVVMPGNAPHSEDFYGFFNAGGAASITIPLWYMGRFTDYMPDLKGKLIIQPMPIWDENSAPSAGLGGTGTSVTTHAKDIQLAKDFLAYAKLSEEGNIEIWRQLGFDPIRTSVWTSDAVLEKNKFTDYFINNPFTDVLAFIGSDFPSALSLEKTPTVESTLNSSVFFQLFDEMKDPKTVLDTFQAQLEADLN